MANNHCALQNVLFPEITNNTDESMGIETVEKLTQDTNDTQTKSKLERFYGFLEVFRIHKDDTKYEATGKYLKLA